jgi:hypothetical protein
VTVLFGGADASGLNGETWEWNGIAWTQRTAAGPSPRYEHAMAYDSCRGVTVLFGGYDGTFDGETWEWNGSEWTLRTTTVPWARMHHALAYDEARGVIVLFGGADNDGLNGETWEWDGSTWTLRTTTGPSPRADHAMAYDSARGVAVLFGGVDGDHSAETWEWPHCTCPGDINYDGRLDGDDIQGFVAHLVGSLFGQPPGPGRECVDVDGDGSVGASDLAVFASLLLSATPCP